MNVADFDFDLPDALIAQDPPPERGASRLLVVDRRGNEVRAGMFADLRLFLRRGDLLVLNNTRVFPARLLGVRAPSGGAVECLLLGAGRPVAAGWSVAGGATGEEWDALVHPGQKLKPGARVRFERDGVTLHGEVRARLFHGRRSIVLWTEDGGPVAAAIERIGHIPLPPYIRREDSEADRERYQTVYASERGSIAAPTAGLHFTPALLADLAAHGIERAEITLHVGYGTFKPVRVEQVEAHVVDAERFSVTAAAAQQLTAARREGRRVIAVGTTTARTLESLAVTDEGEVQPSAGETSLFIHPGHRFRIVDGLLTNFHLPRSSLLMLVAALGGRDRVLAAYAEAVRRGYRFYSYGDAMLLT